jgi:hypothetical protein
MAHPLGELDISTVGCGGGFHNVAEIRSRAIAIRLKSRPKIIFSQRGRIIGWFGTPGNNFSSFDEY